jgi:hypothetical protein
MVATIATVAAKGRWMVSQSEDEIRKLLAEDQWLSTGQVADLFHVVPATVHRWIKAGRFRYRVTGGGQRHLNPEDVRARLAETEKVHGGQAETE